MILKNNPAEKCNLVSEFITKINHVNKNHEIDADDIISFMEYRENFKFFDPCVLDVLLKEFGVCDLTKGFMLRTWLYQNFVKGGLRQITYYVVKSPSFSVENIPFYEEYYEAFKDSLNLRQAYYMDGLVKVAGEYDHNKIIDVLYGLINPYEFIDDVKLRLNEIKLLEKFEEEEQTKTIEMI